MAAQRKKPGQNKLTKSAKSLERAILQVGKKYPELSHITDALGYYVDHKFPIADRSWKPFNAVW